MEQTFSLGSGYQARRISLLAYREACAALEGQIFGENAFYTFDPPTRPAAPLGETWQWGIYDPTETLIGWHHAHAQGERTVYMADTGLLPLHQGRGLYSRLLPHLLETFRAAGFTLVQSHHRATNNAVIVPKLRAGFVVQGINLYEGGVNASLTLSLDATYRAAQDVRSGLRQANSELAHRMGLNLSETAAPASISPNLINQTSSALPIPPALGPETDLGGGYSLRPVTNAEAWAVANHLEAEAYQSVSFDWQAAAPFALPQGKRHAWLILFAGEVAGWQISRQWDARTAYMVNTALLPQHRGKGVYSRLLPVVLEILKAEGYALVRSHHHATNNAVLVPKLRAGFCLQGMEIDHHGMMAVLIYSFDPVYREYMDVRSGLKRPEGEVARRLGMDVPEPKPSSPDGFLPA